MSSQCLLLRFYYYVVEQDDTCHCGKCAGNPAVDQAQAISTRNAIIKDYVGHIQQFLP
ncbi:hypothetical protein D3C71_2218830 [compost metagenome]